MTAGVTELRLRLRLLANDYEPVPVVGKRPVLTEWQKTVPSAALIESWTPNIGRSTGLLTRRTSCFDSDISDPDTMEEIDELVRDRFDDCGTLLIRFGNAPKRAFLFRTDVPFSKKQIIYLPPGMAAEDAANTRRLPRIEFLCDGQQVVAFGIHEDTKKPYSWYAGRDPTNTPRSELPVVDDATADQLMADTHALLLARGYRVYEPKSNGHDKATTEPEVRESADYAAYLRNAASGADVNDAQSRRILSLLNRGEHPDDVEQIVLGETKASGAWDKKTWTENKEIAHIRARIRSGLRKLNSEYDQAAGEIPRWLNEAFHDAWCRVHIDSGWPNLVRPGHQCKVLDVRPKGTEERTARAIPLTAGEWLSRDLPPFDYLMGEWLTTTSRILFSADTGMGKSSFWLAVLAGCAQGVSFLHWRCRRPARVLFVDGEMSRQWLQRMIADACRRLGAVPPTLLILSREDYSNMPPLNTSEGKAFILAFIESVGGADIVVFDNLMSLLVGELREPASWQSTLTLVAELSRRSIGQVWLNHTGHDVGKSYGDKTRDWRMTSTIHLTKIERPDTDVSFELKFNKKRECTPLNRADFQTVKIALVDDTWVCSAAVANQLPPKPGSNEEKCLDLLQAILNGEDGIFEHRGNRATSAKQVWFPRCQKEGVCAAATERVARSTFDRMRRRLVATNMIGCDGDATWIL